MVSNSAYIDVPEEAKTELQITSMVSQFYMDALDYHEPFMENLIQAYGFYDGSRQWVEKDPITGNWVDVKSKLNTQGKPALTKNFIFPLINLVQGVQNNEKLMMKAIPRSNEDQPFADAMSDCITWAWDNNKGDRKISSVFEHGNICGRGWLEVAQVDNEYDIFSTKTTINVVDSAEIIFDRKSREYDLSDCDFLIRERIFPRSLALVLWPEKEQELKVYYGYLNSLIPSSRISENRLMTMRKDIVILECWYRVYELRKFLIDAVSGRVRDVTKVPPEQLQMILEQYPELDVISKHARVMKFAQLVGNAQNGVLLDNGPSPYDDNLYPYVPYFAYRGRNLDFGIVKNCIDPQYEINKRDSQMLHIINEMPKTKIVTDDQDLADRFEQGEEIIVTRPGAKFQIIEPPKLPVAFAHMIEKNKDDIKRISGVSDDLRGIKSGQESGAVVDIRRQMAMNNISRLFDNLHSTAEQATRLLMSRIRQFMPPDEIARILGPEKAHPMLIKAIKEKAVHEYDIAITQSPSSPTLRRENFMKLDAIIKNLPVAIQMGLGDVYIEASDIPQKDEIKARFAPGSNGPPPPGGNGPVREITMQR